MDLDQPGIDATTYQAVDAQHYLAGASMPWLHNNSRSVVAQLNLSVAEQLLSRIHVQTTLASEHLLPDNFCPDPGTIHTKQCELYGERKVGTLTNSPDQG